MRCSCLASPPYHWNCPGRLMMRSSFVGCRHQTRLGSRASPSRRSGRAPRALPWRSSPARSRASPQVDATLRVSPPGGVSQLRGRLETLGGCRSARTGTSLSSTSHPIYKSRRRCPLALLVQRQGVQRELNSVSSRQTVQVELSAAAGAFECECLRRRVGGRPLSRDARVKCPVRRVARRLS